MSTERSLSPAFIKFLLFLVCVIWILYYIETGKKENPEHETYMIEFENLKFSYEIEKRNVACNNKDILIAISSAPDAFNLRMAFRKEWAKNVNNSSVIYRFFVGYSANETIKQANYEESKAYDDIVVSNIFDTYITSVFKTYSIFKWQQNYCPSVKYILRSRDSILISVSRLLYWIENEFDNEYKASDEKVIFCKTMEHFDSSVKYKIKGNNQSGFEYCEDYAYLVSATATKLMIKEALHQKMKNSIEDLMFTGLLAEAIGAQRIHSPKHFTTTLANCGCDKNQVPYVISSLGHWSDNIKFMSDYSIATKNFANMSCSTKSNKNIEFFKACVAHTG